MPVGVDQAGRGQVSTRSEQAAGIIQGLVSRGER